MNIIFSIFPDPSCAGTRKGLPGPIQQ
jgi:hypothetical protein